MSDKRAQIAVPELAEAGISRDTILRTLDRLLLAQQAPDLPPARRERIIEIREDIRRGVYVTEQHLRQALLGAIADVAHNPAPQD